jgi:hypothetical protein
VLKPVVARYQDKVSRIYFRADAGFANPSPVKAVRATSTTPSASRPGFLPRRPGRQPRRLSQARSGAARTHAGAGGGLNIGRSTYQKGLL